MYTQVLNVLNYIQEYVVNWKKYLRQNNAIEDIEEILIKW